MKVWNKKMLAKEKEIKMEIKVGLEEKLDSVSEMIRWATKNSCAIPHFNVYSFE